MNVAKLLDAIPADRKRVAPEGATATFQVPWGSERRAVAVSWPGATPHPAPDLAHHYDPPVERAAFEAVALPPDHVVVLDEREQNVVFGLFWAAPERTLPEPAVPFPHTSLRH